MNNSGLTLPWTEDDYKQAFAAYIDDYSPVEPCIRLPHDDNRYIPIGRQPKPTGKEKLAVYFKRKLQQVASLLFALVAMVGPWLVVGFLG